MRPRFILLAADRKYNYMRRYQPAERQCYQTAVLIGTQKTVLVDEILHSRGDKC
jgi:hypothetical protein